MTEFQLLVLTTITYLAITVCGFLVSIFLGLTSTDFGGYCVLFTDVMWIDENHFIAEFGDTTACDFASYLPVCACIAHGTIMAVYHGYILLKALTSKHYAIVDTMWVLPWFLVNIFVTISTLATSLVITVGFYHTCAQLIVGQINQYESCSEFQDNIEWINPIGDRINTSKFYRNTSIAQFSSWVCSVLWMVVVVISGLRLWRQSRCSRSCKADLSPVSSCSSQDTTITDLTLSA